MTGGVGGTVPLTDRIDADIKLAMKERRKDDLRGLRAVKQALQLAATDGSGRAIDEQRETEILQKLVKQRRDSLKIYDEQGRDDLAAVERQEIATIEAYLPEALDADALARMVATTIQQLGAASMRDMGKVVAAMKVKAAGRAEGSAIAAEVKRQLQG